MKLDQLNHKYTPKALGDINQRIATHLSEHTFSESNFTELLKLLEMRDKVIQRHLLTIEGTNLESFVSAELRVNSDLQELAQNLLDLAKDDVSKFIRSQSAIKKYK